MKTHQLILLFLAALWIQGCVSVHIETPQVKRSSNVLFTSPSEPFAPIESAQLDKLWQDPKTGNTISFLSECDNKNNPSLENIERGILTEIQRSKKIETNPITIAGQDGVHSIIDGFVDEVASRVELVIFKKDRCIYIITHAAVQKHFASSQRTFQKFVKEFYVK